MGFALTMTPGKAGEATIAVAAALWRIGDLARAGAVSFLPAASAVAKHP